MALSYLRISDPPTHHPPPILNKSVQNYFAPISNFGQGRVFRVRSKPSKQPLGLVARGVPIEKVQAKRAMHSDRARGVAGAWSLRRRKAAPGEVQLQTRP